MKRRKTASLAILGAAAIVASVLAGPATAKDTMAKGTKANQATTSKSLAKNQHHAAYRGMRFRNANAALTSERSYQYRRAAGPGNVVGNAVGGAVATGGAIATAPFRAFGNNNYYGNGYGGRDWRTYAAHNGLACTPGTTFRGADGRRHLCQ